MASTTGSRGWMIRVGTSACHVNYVDVECRMDKVSRPRHIRLHMHSPYGAPCICTVMFAQNTLNQNWRFQTMTTGETHVRLFVLCNSNFIKSGVCLSQLQAGSVKGCQNSANSCSSSMMTVCHGKVVVDCNDGNDGRNDGDDSNGGGDCDEDENEDQILDI